MSRSLTERNTASIVSELMKANVAEGVAEGARLQLIGLLLRLFSGDLCRWCTRTADLFDYSLRALSCGAFSVDEAGETGLSTEELRTRSVYRRLRARRGGS